MAAKFISGKGLENLTVTAHSGCMGLPDNSVESMEAGVKAGAQMVEIDLSFDSLGLPVLSHDKVKEGEKYCPLSDVFEFLASHPGIKANIDVKDTSHLETVPGLAKEYSVADRIFFTGICEKDVAAAKEKAPEIPYYLNASCSRIFGIKKTVKKARELGAIGINTNYRGLSKRLVTEAHEEGLLVSVWTVNSVRTAKFALERKPDNITSRCPDLIFDTVKKYVR